MSSPLADHINAYHSYADATEGERRGIRRLLVPPRPSLLPPARTVGWIDTDGKIVPFEEPKP